MTREHRWLHEMEARWADRPRPVPGFWYGRVPDWVYQSRLAALREGLDALYLRGELVWGLVLMANQAAWNEGRDAAPGEVIWCEDPHARRFPHCLGVSKVRYWALKKEQAKALGVPGLRALVPFARDDHRPAGRWRFPELLSDGRVVWHATMLFYREHLPTARLRSELVPLVRVPSGDPPLVTMLPRTFWPEDFTEAWTNGG